MVSPPRTRKALHAVDDGGGMQCMWAARRRRRSGLPGDDAEADGELLAGRGDGAGAAGLRARDVSIDQGVHAGELHGGEEAQHEGLRTIRHSGVSATTVANDMIISPTRMVLPTSAVR